MTIDHGRVAAALATPQHPEQEVEPVVERYLRESDYDDEYEDFLALESFRTALAGLAEPERRRRAVAFAACWDGNADAEARARFARAGFAQGIDYHQLRDGDEPELLGPSFAPISWYDVDGLMGVLAHVGGTGEHLAACVDFAAFGTRDPRVFEWFGEAFERKNPYDVIALTFASPRETDDRLLELMLAPLGHDHPIALERFVDHVLSWQSTGAQDVERLDVCSRWLEARGHRPVAPAIDLRDPRTWDGGHRSGGNAVQRFLARLWAADPALVEPAAENLFKRMWAPAVVAAVCASLPFEEKVELADRVEYKRLYRQGRLVVTHTGKAGKAGRVSVTLHPDAAKAAKAAKKKADAMRAGP